MLNYQRLQYFSLKTQTHVHQEIPVPQGVDSAKLARLEEDNDGGTARI
jgi:hypothetical protein